MLVSRHALLILDDCEHLVEGSARLAESLLRSCPKLAILATSREPLQIGGETVLPVPTLHTVDPERPPSVKDLLECEAVRLFADRAAAVRPGFVLNAENAKPVTEICHRLDGIPLAIELAAARVQMFSVEHISERLQDPDNIQLEFFMV